MPAADVSPLPVSPLTGRSRLLPFGAIWAIATVAVAAFCCPDCLLRALALAGLLSACAVWFEAIQTPVPKRLVPIGMAGSLAVKLAGDSMLVGRLPCCRVEIPLPTVSSRHCRLYRAGSRWYVEDLNSRNGTFVNGKRIRRKRLHVGDKISIGEFSFRVQ